VIQTNFPSKVKTWWLSFKNSLRARVALGVALPLLVALSTLSMIHYWRELQLVEEQTHRNAVQLGEVLTSSLNHAMLIKDGENLKETLEDIGSLDNVQRVQIIGLSGKTLADSTGGSLQGFNSQQDSGCRECHDVVATERPRAIEFPATEKLMRISTPVEMRSECAECHTENSSHLGVVLVDMSFQDTQQHLLQSLRLDLGMSAIFTLLITTGIYWLIHLLVVRRVEVFQKPLADFASGNLSVRIPQFSKTEDEVNQLIKAFNQMMDEIANHTREQIERSELKERAIIEERARIARELHDGISQVLGYVNTKAMAVRLMLQKGQLNAADRQLLQLEEAARGLSMDVREAILGLKMAGQSDLDLKSALENYVDEFSRLSDLPVRLSVSIDDEEVVKEDETVLQMLRIVQESLTNVRKHAEATQAWVDLYHKNGVLNLSIRDNGLGFDADHIHQENNQHYGLITMQERSEHIGATLEITSKAGIGTQVMVQWSPEHDGE
jgi:signal transduction histidine kinase